MTDKQYADALAGLMDRIAASLQRDGVLPGQAISICASSSIAYGATFLGGLRAGVAVAPLAPSSTPESLAVMLADCGAKRFFRGASATAFGRSFFTIGEFAGPGSAPAIFGVAAG